VRIACFTVAALDYFPQQKQYFAGGNSLNQAIRLSQMGYATAFFGALGEDEAGDRIMDLLLRNRVDVSRLYRLPGKTVFSTMTQASASVWTTPGTAEFMKLLNWAMKIGSSCPILTYG
jgi:sugar/nucleoside kinase (ribokinase family)